MKNNIGQQAVAFISLTANHSVRASMDRAVQWAEQFVWICMFINAPVSQHLFNKIS